MSKDSVQEKYMKAKFDYDVCCEVVELLTGMPYGTADIKERAITEKNEAKAAHSEALDWLLLQMKMEGTNVLKLVDSWHAVRTTGRKKSASEVRVAAIQDHLVYMLVRADDALDMTKQQLDALLPSIQDEVAMSTYEGKVKKYARIHLQTAYGLDVEEETSEQEVGTSSKLVVSHHAGWRYVQRVKGIASEFAAVDYVRAHRNEIQEEIANKFSTAQTLWQDIDGIEYRFDADNLMYVYNPEGQTIITIYEVDYRFAKHINRQIVFEQIEVIKQQYSRFEQLKQEQEQQLKHTQDEIQGIEDQLKALKAEMDALVAHKSKLLATRDHLDKDIKAAWQNYALQFNKVFKKFEAEQED